MTVTLKPAPNAALLLADGTVFFGAGVGAHGSIAGEVCFNTAMTGYQEILTDPSYSGQVITFTAPHIGNVGCNVDDIESPNDGKVGTGSAYGACGVILREAITAPSNFRSGGHFDAWLAARGITGISGIDTRALTRHIRLKGAQNCAIAYLAANHVAGVTREELLKKAKAALEAAPDMDGLELAAHATTKAVYQWQEPRWSLTPPPAGGRSGQCANASSEQVTPPPHPSPCGGGSSSLHVVAVDYGVKHNILRSLVSAGCRLTVVPAMATAEEILAHKPDGIFLSNGPGDPAATAHYALPTIKKLIESKLPMFGICLGHQLLGLALGARTEKMKQGHRGANHPVKDLTTGKVEITSQNHGFAVSDQALPADVEITHRSLFDNTVQGIRHKSLPIFSVQGHPEASPGPHDSQYLFERFVAMMQGNAKRAA